MWLNSAVGRFHSLDLNQCAGGMGQFLSKELNQSSSDIKSLSLPTKEIRGSKDVWATLKGKKITNGICENPWKYHGKIMEFCHYKKWEP